MARIHQDTKTLTQPFICRKLAKGLEALSQVGLFWNSNVNELFVLINRVPGRTTSLLCQSSTYLPAKPTPTPSATPSLA